MITINKGYASTFFWREDEYGIQILLQKKDRGWKGADFWTPFGGVIEENEVAIDCVVREAKEELNLDFPKEAFNFFKTVTTLNRKNEEAPLHVFYAHFPYPLRDVKLDEGCGLAFWYTDEIPKVEMQPNERLVLLELIEHLN